MSSYIEINSESDFNTRVVEQSFELPVVVDFWAPWCAPCRMLGPILEKVVASYKGRIILAKVNTDELQQLAGKFGISGIPAVKIFRDGKIASEFTGVQSEQVISTMLDEILPSETDKLVKEAELLMSMGKIEDAGELYRKVLELDAHNSAAGLALVGIFLERNDIFGAKKIMDDHMDQGTDEYFRAEKLVKKNDMKKKCAEQGGSEEARRNYQVDSGLDNAFKLASCLAAEDAYEEALEIFIGILEKKPDYQDGAAKEAMLEIFEQVGPRDPLSEKYRARMAQALFR